MGDRPSNTRYMQLVYLINITYILCSLSEEDFDEETTEADGEVQIVLECWTEPQFGLSCSNPPERSHWDGQDYKGIARSVSLVLPIKVYYNYGFSLHFNLL